MRSVKKVRCIVLINKFSSLSKDVEEDIECNDYYHRVDVPSDKTKDAPHGENISEPQRRYLLRPRRQPQYLNDHVTGDELSDEDNVHCNIDYCYNERSSSNIH